MQHYWLEFSAVAVAHLLAVASPGPDFALVLRQSLNFGRQTALWTSVGIGSGILVHVAYSLLGLGLLIRSSPVWFNVVKIAGTVYLAWLGIQSLRSRPRAAEEIVTARAAGLQGNGQAFGAGFLTNVLNPKATLFFISLFAMIVSPDTPRWIRVGYGAWMAIATAAWFSLVSVLFTQPVVRRRFLAHGHWLDRALGVFFLAFAASLAVASLP